MNRRHALRNLGAFLAGSPLLRSQQDLPYTPERLPPIDELVNVFEFEPLMKHKVPKVVYDYVAGGVDYEVTLRRNRDAFDRITFRPRFLRNVTKMDLSLELYGRKLGMPILIAPTAGHNAVHPEGELASARGAQEVKSVLVVSTNTSQPIEKITEAAGEPQWFQLYPGPDMEGTRERVDRALGAGCKVIMLTVDAAYNSHRERLLRDRNVAQVPPGVGSPQSRRRRAAEQPPLPYKLQATFMAYLDWNFVDTLMEWAKVPVLIKGILTPEDAELSVKRGVAGIVVSNHGGRYLDGAPSTIEVLPEIIDAVGGKIPVLVDSGFRRGTDILKALAIGAKAVLVGRPPLWGLGAFGQQGIARVMELLQTELALAMGLAGRTALAEIDRSVIKIG